MADPHVRRVVRHIVTDQRAVRRAFPEAALKAIEGTIAAGERTHRGQVCVAIEPSLPPVRVLRHLSPRERALEVFGLLRVWDTEENAGVLLYLLLADRDVEIVADRGIDRLVGPAVWQDICAALEAEFRAGRYADGVIQAVTRISSVLAARFPRGERDALPDELPNRPTLL
jgi:uncharacterized membrane protein